MSLRSDGVWLNMWSTKSGLNTSLTKGLSSAGLMARAKSLLTIGDIAAARLLLERAANAQDATAAFLLAQTYDPAVLGTKDTRSITADAVAARDWYRKAAQLGSAEARQRLSQLQN